MRCRDRFLRNLGADRDCYKAKICQWAPRKLVAIFKRKEASTGIQAFAKARSVSDGGRTAARSTPGAI